MERLFDLDKLQKELGKLIGIDGASDNKANDEKLKGAILLIYNSARERIFQVADNVTRGIVKSGENINVLDEAEPPSLPETEEWDFRLGDTVRIALSREDFKWTQKKTIGWRANLNEEYGQVGIVSNVFSKFENSIGVYFPDVYTACSLYAGTLEKVKPREESTLLSRWKVGDFVKAVPSPKVLAMLLRGLNQVPKDKQESRGRIVGVTHPCIIVTFDEKETLFLKSSALIPSDDDSPLPNPEVEHDRGFKVGDEVQLISNMKKLIQNQKDEGGWNSDMSVIRGKKARVIRIDKDGNLILQTTNNRGWKVSPDSVLSPGEKETVEDDLDFLPGDVVKVFVPRNVRVILAMAEVPSVFLEFLRTSAVISLVDDDLDYYIRFNQTQNIEAHSETLRKATQSEKEKHERIEERVQSLKKGQLVHLDIGPPNFVQAVIAELNLDPMVKMALTRSATLVGFVSPYIAVIEYENGLRCRVKRQYLTVPEKFYMEQSRETVEPETVAQIRDAIATSVQNLHTRESVPTEDWRVYPILMFHGNPPCVEYKIESTVATYKAIFAWLEENSGWDLEALGDGQFVICGAELSNYQVKVGVVFNDEKSEFASDIATSKPDMISGGHEEGVTAKNKAEGFDTEPNRQSNERPVVNTIQDFQYVRLYNPALARTVYFPYVVSRQRRTPTEPVGPDVGQHGHPSVVNTVTHVTYYNN